MDPSTGAIDLSLGARSGTGSLQDAEERLSVTRGEDRRSSTAGLLLRAADLDFSTPSNEELPSDRLDNISPERP
jgi:hypothetical protein